MASCPLAGCPLHRDLRIARSALLMLATVAQQAGSSRTPPQYRTQWDGPLAPGTVSNSGSQRLRRTLSRLCDAFDVEVTDLLDPRPTGSPDQSDQPARAITTSGALMHSRSRSRFGRVARPAIASPGGEARRGFVSCPSCGATCERSWARPLGAARSSQPGGHAPPSSVRGGTRRA